MIEGDPKKLETAHELAAFLTVSPATVYGYAKRRIIPFYRVGDRVLFDRDQVLAAIKVPAETDDFEILKKTVVVSGQR